MIDTHSPSPGNAVRACALLLAIAACGGAPETKGSMIVVSDDKKLAADRMFVRDPFDDQVKQGVLRQRTIGDAHFVWGSSELTTLGKRDVAILASGLKNGANQRIALRGGESAALREARMSTLKNEFAKLGVAVTLDEGPTGGKGIASGEALLLLQESRSGRWGEMKQTDIKSDIKQGGSE